MAVSEARLLANRANSLKSTGPSAEGKLNSRRNGLKHGMTGRGVVVAESDAAEVERRDATLRAEMDPRSAIGSILIRQMATLSVRMERGAIQEMAAVASRSLHAAEAFDEERHEQAAGLMAKLGDDPRGCLRRLRRSPEGLDLLAEAWRALRAKLTRAVGASWEIADMARMANLSGIGAEEARRGRLGALSMAAWCFFEGLTEQDGAGLTREARRDWARARLVERIDAEIAGLEAHRATVDLRAIEQDRAGAADRALFDPSKEAKLARRYEAEARRGFFRALQEFRQAEAEAEIEVEEEVKVAAPASASAPETARAEPSMASSWVAPAPVPFEVPRVPGPASSTGFSTARGLDGGVLTVGRRAPRPG